MHMHLIFPETRNKSHWPTFLSLIVAGLSLFKCVQWAPKHASFLQQSAFSPFEVIQGRWFWYQPKVRIGYDFLLVRHCDYGPMLHRFWDKAMAIYWLKLPIFPTPLSFGDPAPYVPFGISRWNYSRGAICTVAWAVLTWYGWYQPVTDRQTDGFTVASTALCIASYADAL